MKDGMAGKSGERSRSLSRKETRFLKIKIFLKDGKFSRKVFCYVCIHTKTLSQFSHEARNLGDSIHWCFIFISINLNVI